jgi:predicted lipoprotein with Yx(FWY)xxD motif
VAGRLDTGDHNSWCATRHEPISSEGGTLVRVWNGRGLGLPRRPLVALVVLAAAAVLAAGCGSNGSGSSSGGSSSGSGGMGGYGSSGTAPASGGASSVATVSATSTSLGMILVDGSGRTLYLFEKDQPNQSACAGACAAAWPVDQTSGTPKAGSGVTASMLGTIKRSDNTTQVTYNKHPLYYFQGDSGAGQHNGQGVDAFGAKWYVVTPAGGADTGA